MLKTLVILSGLVCMVLGVPLYLDFEGEDQLRGVPADQPLHYQVKRGAVLGNPGKETWYDELPRVRRSPQQFGLGANAYPGGAGSLRAQLDSPNWTSNNGRHSLQGNAYYQRNFNMPGPRQDWGAQATYTYRF